jgi:hypothetical protein
MLKKIRTLLTITGLTFVLLLAGGPAWSSQEPAPAMHKDCDCNKNLHKKGCHHKSGCKHKDCTCKCHKGTGGGSMRSSRGAANMNEGTEDVAIVQGYESSPLYNSEYPDPINEGSFVRKTEPGPDLSRTQPFTNEAYK